MAVAAIGVFSGSGFYEFLDDVEEVEVETPFGRTSAPLVVGDVGGAKVAFLPRHGRRHELPPAQNPAQGDDRHLRSLGTRGTEASSCQDGTRLPNQTEELCCTCTAIQLKRTEPDDRT